MRIAGTPQHPLIAGDESFPSNKGALCVKGYTAGATLNAPDRLRAPLVRNARGALVPSSWDDALEHVASAIRAIQRRHGRDAIAVFGSGALTNEKRICSVSSRASR
jgi:assimilatory nitrate reductase catalytic subunit